MAKWGSPWRKFVVPSRGSTIQQRLLSGLPALAPDSSMRKA
jgi:hypothetical protein